ncbi:I78 family peptidase inhibitor [Xanthomonas sp. A2111]|uniref:I78 family peptidase inhibitor n=1 Tax=Xanthomonas hawaiiensis TaxID=3003247 RepID=A0ABU2I5B7_9XANT|nr:MULTISPECIES: I78 family peptidase inhibitor [unclassified Xanthomonas]MDS9993317.1 I78 family peptidase inhibitor [Xanthomonas sp. A2111]WNH45054.1 I78 family peptidase inhibitor [Xanthomonas sp. A6251]
MSTPLSSRASTRAGLLGTACLALALAACGAPPPDEQEQVSAKAQAAAQQAAAPDPANAPDAPPVGSCDASQAQGLVGQTFAPALLDQARSDTGAKTARVLKPNQAVTMEFNGERLNIEVDEKDQITGVRCG